MHTTEVPAPRPTTVPRSLTAQAEAQHGLVSVEQVRATGLSRAALRNQVAQGDWEMLTPRVARRTGSPETPGQRALAAVLDVGPGACVSHRSAAALWDLPGFVLDPVEVTVPRDGCQTATTLATTHRPRHLPEPFATVLDGVPVVRPALLVLQLAADIHPERLRRLVDRLWSRRLLSGPSLRTELAELMHRGRPGTAALRALLDELPPGYVPPASNLEARALAVLDQADLGPFRRQVDLGDDEQWCGRVDLLHGELPLVVEVDGEAWHTALSDAAHDARRRERLEAVGFEVARVREHDVWHRPEVAVATVREAMWRARARAQRCA